ncbi:MAG: polyprenyl synthetase family protein [Planctomycetota bacterium]
MTEAEPARADGDTASSTSENEGAFKAFSKRWRPRIEQALEEILPPADRAPSVLHEAMRYAMFPGGKRFRPLLALCAAEAGGGDPEMALRPAAALELVHTYSLVHDDLPCMDDDALRRGRPTCHVAFDEANALLAGDALLTLAFEVTAEAGGGAVVALARAAGSLGMVGGQVEDLEAENLGKALTLEHLERIHDGKTGALITSSLEVGLHAGGCDLSAVEEWRRFGNAVGRAFQVADDCLDLTGTAEELGKQPGQDLAHGKSTYPSLLGLEKSLDIAHGLVAEASDLAERICSPAGRQSVDGGVSLLQDLALAAVRRKA